MKNILILLISIFLSHILVSQNSYFQQWVNYEIRVKVDPFDKSLSAWEKMVYYNNSPDTLHFIYIHLWPAAYQKGTALCRQLANRGKDNLFLAQREYSSYVDSLNFKINEQAIIWKFYKNNKDIAILYLNEPLLPGDSIVITTPFYVKIPKILSRFGYDDKVIAISQWYPKPAVYDRYGWHPISYLDQGEFYSEFGNFDVKITLPSQYAIAATGNMLDTTEKKWLSLLENSQAKDIPYPKPLMWKTIRFVQDSVHDFAFFISDQYYVKESKVKLPLSSRTVNTRAFFVEKNTEWQNAVSYLDSAIFYYSKWIGNYPYKVCTVVQGPLSAGGGMEYPTITVISTKANLEQVIVHEVGHNWFYGVLAFNERLYPFLDEGINSYYDHRYTKMKQLENFIPEKFGEKTIPSLPEILNVASYFGVDQPLNLHSQQYSPLAYWLIVYEKMAFSLAYLQEYLGIEEFDRIMQTFYKTWAFKHPYPEDLKNCFVNNSTKPVNWFFDELITSNKIIDYSVKTSKKGIKLKNTGQIAAPMIVEINNKPTWYLLQPHAKKIITHEKTKVFIDPQKITLDKNPYNNFSNGKWFNKPLKLTILPRLFDYKYNYVVVSPIIYKRFYDGVMPGVLLTNFTLPYHRFSYLLSAFYGLKSFVPSTMVYFRYIRPPINGFPKMNVSVYADNFILDNDRDFNRLRKLAIYLKFNFWNKDLSDKWQKKLKLGFIRIENSPLSFSNEIGMRYVMKNKSKVYPTKFNIMAMRLYNLPFYWAKEKLDLVIMNFEFLPVHYTSLSTGLKIRTSLGYNAPVMAMDGITDFDHSHLFISRYDTNSFLKNQVVVEYGGFLLKTPSFIYPWFVSVNMISTLPFKKLNFIQGFFNLAYTQQDKWLYEGGVKIEILNLSLYLPIFINSSLQEANPSFKPFKTYSFAISMDTDKILKF